MFPRILLKMPRAVFSQAHQAMQDDRNKEWFLIILFVETHQRNFCFMSFCCASVFFLCLKCETRGTSPRVSKAKTDVKTPT
jgi:hypothetical protein